MQIRRLTRQDAAAFQALRLAALKEAPTVFGSSFEEERDFPPPVIEARLAIQPDQVPFGALEDGAGKPVAPQVGRD